MDPGKDNKPGLMFVSHSPEDVAGSCQGVKVIIKMCLEKARSFLCLFQVIFIKHWSQGPTFAWTLADSSGNVSKAGSVMSRKRALFILVCLCV